MFTENKAKRRAFRSNTVKKSQLNPNMAPCILTKQSLANCEDVYALIHIAPTGLYILASLQIVINAYYQFSNLSISAVSRHWLNPLPTYDVNVVVHI